MTLLAPGQFFGTTATNRFQDEILYSARHYSPNTCLPSHSHEAPFFCLLLEGSYRERYCYREVHYGPFGLVFHPAGETHSTRMGDQGGVVFCIELGGRWIRMLNDISTTETRIEQRGGPLSWLARQVYRDSMESQPLLSESLICEMLARTLRNQSEKRTSPSWLPIVVDWIHDRHHSSFTITQIAKEMKVHPFHLSRVFRYFHGISIGEYLNRVRIDRAMQLLASRKPMRLCELAIDLGFADQSHFTRTFRKLTGTSPSSYRRNIAGI